MYYDVTNFLEKNKDAIHADVKAMVQKSAVPFVAKLFVDSDAGGAAAAAPSKVRGRAGGVPAARQ